MLLNLAVLLFCLSHCCCLFCVTSGTIQFCSLSSHFGNRHPDEWYSFRAKKGARHTDEQPRRSSKLEASNLGAFVIITSLSVHCRAGKGKGLAAGTTLISELKLARQGGQISNLYTLLSAAIPQYSHFSCRPVKITHSSQQSCRCSISVQWKL